LQSLVTQACGAHIVAKLPPEPSIAFQRLARFTAGVMWYNNCIWDLKVSTGKPWRLGCTSFGQEQNDD
jgi:hypothetical protein